LPGIESREVEERLCVLARLLAGDFRIDFQNGSVEFCRATKLALLFPSSALCSSV
jgi:hypothetical protein